jgi:hypothetical protein
MDRSVMAVPDINKTIKNSATIVNKDGGRAYNANNKQIDANNGGLKPFLHRFFTI